MIDLDRLAKMLSDDVLCVAAMAVNNEIGTIQDIAGHFGGLRENEWEPISSASTVPGSRRPRYRCRQQVGHAPTYRPTRDLRPEGHWRPVRPARRSRRDRAAGPRRPTADRAFRAGTLPTPLCVGFGAAAELLLTGEADAERSRVAGLRGRFELELCRSRLSPAIQWPRSAPSPGQLQRFLH